MSIRVSISAALFSYGLAALIGMFVAILIKVTYFIIHLSQRRAKRVKA